MHVLQMGNVPAMRSQVKAAVPSRLKPYGVARAIKKNTRIPTSHAPESILDGIMQGESRDVFRRRGHVDFSRHMGHVWNGDFVQGGPEQSSDLWLVLDANLLRPLNNVLRRGIWYTVDSVNATLKDLIQLHWTWLVNMHATQQQQHAHSHVVIVTPCSNILAHAVRCRLGPCLAPQRQWKPLSACRKTCQLTCPVHLTRCSSSDTKACLEQLVESSCFMAAAEFDITPQGQVPTPTQHQ